MATLAGRPLTPSKSAPRRGLCRALIGSERQAQRTAPLKVFYHYRARVMPTHLQPAAVIFGAHRHE